MSWLFSRATDLARMALDQDTYDHACRVAEALRLQDYDDDVIVAGLLHDVVEDSDVTVADLIPVFGERVANAVDAVTRREGELYFDFVRRAAAHPDGRHVKHADVRDNLGRPGGPESLRRRYRRALEMLGGRHAR